MRIGLTGASGTLGRHIAAHLAQSGHQVVPFKGDVRERAAVVSFVDGLDYVVHSAAIVPVDQVRDDLPNAVHVNVIGSVNVAEAVARQGTCGLAYISTSHVYAPSDEPLTESGATKPPSQYGLTKLQGENWILSIKPDALAIRVFSFFDPVQPASYLVPALTKRIRAAERGAVMPLRGALCKRDIADASWLAALCTALVTRNIKGIVNCGTGHGYLVREIAERLAAAMGRRDLSWQGFPEDGINALVADIQTLSAALGAPPAFDLDTSFADYVAALR